VIAAPRQLLKTGAEHPKQEQDHRRAEFFALPFVVGSSTTANAKAIEILTPS
jgi:hypothetical protein